MNLKRLLIFLSFISLTAALLYNCERDDICAESTSTTPRLIIEFYDGVNPNNLKNVPRLTVYGEGLITDENGLEIQPTEASSATLVFNENINTVELPLIIGAEGETTTTRFVLEKDTDLRLNPNVPGTSNVDIIEITYTSEFVYVSRACGHKSIFNGVGIAIDSDTNPWISNIEILETTIDNENSAHVRILH